MPTRLSSPWPNIAARKQVPNLPCNIPRPNPHNHPHPSKKPETISNKTQQEAQEENPHKREEDDLRYDGEVHKRGTSSVEVVEGAHRVQGVVIKMGEVVRPCDDWHTRHDCRVLFLLGYGSRICMYVCLEKEGELRKVFVESL